MKRMHRAPILPILFFGILMVSNPLGFNPETVLQDPVSSLLDSPQRPLLAQGQSGNPWLIDGMIVYNHTSYGEILVWNHTSHGLIKHTQYANLTSYLTGTNALDFAFEYNSSLTVPKKVYQWQNISHSLRVDDFINTTNGFIWPQYLEGYNETYVKVHWYDFVNITGFYWYEMINSGSHSEESWYYDWNDITVQFTHDTNPLNDLDLQWITDVTFDEDQTRMIKFEYDTPLGWNYAHTDLAGVGRISGKWGLWIKRHQDSIQEAWQNNRYVYLDPWWDSDWGYRKYHTINSAEGAGTNYQVKIIVHYGSGSDSGDEVYCNSHCETNFGDIRFIDNDNSTELDYWMQESYTSDNATFWVEVQDDLSSANVNIWLYYGKSGASTTSDGYQTFLLFDEFPGSTLNTTHWELYSGAITISGGYLWLNGTSGTRGMVESVDTFGPNVTLHSYASWESERVGSGHFTTFRDSVGHDFDPRVAVYGLSSGNYERFRTESGPYTETDTSDTSLQGAGWLLYETNWWAGSSTEVGESWRDGVSQANHTTNIPNGALDVCFAESSNDGQDYRVDWVSLGKWVSPEPVHGTWGEEEESGGGGDETAPSFSYVGTTNSSSVELGTSISANWSITEANPSKYIIYSNETGTGNVSRESGSYSNGNYVEWPFTNTNASNVGLTLFFQVWANDTSANSNSSIVYFTIVDTTAPSLSYDAGTSTTNNSNVEINTGIVANWSLSDAAPDTYILYCNETGTNSTVQSGSWSSGDYKNYSPANTNITNIDKVIFVELIANDTSDNRASETAYFTIVDTTDPSLSYTGTTNESSVEWESGGSITVSWTVTEAAPNLYVLYWNQTGSNTTRASGSYSGSVSNSYNPTLSDVGNLIWFQVVVNDTTGNSATETAYFTITNTDAPTLNIDSPSNRTYTGNVTVTLTCANSDLDTLWYEIYYTNGTQHTSNTTYSSSVELDLPVASYYLKGYANDTAGNEDSGTIYFTVSTAPTTTAPTGGIVPKLKAPALKLGGLVLPFASILLIAGTLFGTQLVQDTRDYAAWEIHRRRILLFSALAVIFYVVLYLLEVKVGAMLFDFGQSLQSQVRRVELALLPVWNHLMKPAIPWGQSTFPVFGILAFGIAGVSAYYNLNTDTQGKEWIRQRFLQISVLALLWSAIILLNIPALITSGITEGKLFVARMTVLLTPVWARLMQPAVPFLGFYYPVLGGLISGVFGFGALYISKEPRALWQQLLRRLLMAGFFLVLIYCLGLFLIPTQLKGGLNYVETTIRTIWNR